MARYATGNAPPSRVSITVPVSSPTHPRSPSPSADRTASAASRRAVPATRARAACPSPANVADSTGWRGSPLTAISVPPLARTASTAADMEASRIMSADGPPIRSATGFQPRISIVSRRSARRVDHVMPGRSGKPVRVSARDPRRWVGNAMTLCWSSMSGPVPSLVERVTPVRPTLPGSRIGRNCADLSLAAPWAGLHLWRDQQPDRRAILRAQAVDPLVHAVQGETVRDRARHVEASGRHERDDLFQMALRVAQVAEDGQAEERQERDGAGLDGIERLPDHHHPAAPGTPPWPGE